MMRLVPFLAAACLLIFATAVVHGEDVSYVGSKTCPGCHEEQYETFNKYSRKDKYLKSREIMASDLKPDELQGCYECHTTGHGKPGGFVDIRSTPDKAEVGCETCHGPGSATPNPVIRGTWCNNRTWNCA